MQLTKTDGKIVATSTPFTVEVAEDGTAYCTPENSSESTSRKLTTDEFSQLTTKVKGRKIEKAGGGKVTDKTGVPAVNTFKNITINNPNGKSSLIYFFDSAKETPQFKQAAADIEAICDTTTVPVPIESLPQWEAPVSVSRKGLFQKIASAIMPTASAQSFALANDPTAADIQYTRLDVFRKEKALTVRAQRIPCIDAAAQEWSREMAATGWLRHSVVGNLVGRHCGPNWEWLGENVGWYGGTYNMGSTPDPADMDSVNLSNRMFDEFINSPHHYDNLVQPMANASGYGVYQAANGQMYITQIFADCDKCPGFNTKSSTY